MDKISKVTWFREEIQTSGSSMNQSSYFHYGKDSEQMCKLLTEVL